MAGGCGLATRLAPLTELASDMRAVANQDTYSDGVKDSIDIALYMMGGGLSLAEGTVDESESLAGAASGWLIDRARDVTELLDRAAHTELAERTIDWLTAPAEWTFDTLITNPVAYWSERFFTNAGETSAPVAIC